MVSVAERKRLYSSLLPNTHTLIHNIKSHPADFFFFVCLFVCFLTLRLTAVGRRKGLQLTEEGRGQGEI